MVRRLDLAADPDGQLADPGCVLDVTGGEPLQELPRRTSRAGRSRASPRPPPSSRAGAPGRAGWGGRNAAGRGRRPFPGARPAGEAREQPGERVRESPRPVPEPVSGAGWTSGAGAGLGRLRLLADAAGPSRGPAPPTGAPRFAWSPPRPVRIARSHEGEEGIDIPQCIAGESVPKCPACWLSSEGEVTTFRPERPGPRASRWPSPSTTAVLRITGLRRSPNAGASSSATTSGGRRRPRRPSRRTSHRRPRPRTSGRPLSRDT